MGEIIGTVQCVRVNDDAGFTTIEDAAGELEVLILWFIAARIPPTLTSFTRVLHSMWLSMLREAHTNNLPVTIVTQGDTGIVMAVQLGG